LDATAILRLRDKICHVLPAPPEKFVAVDTTVQQLYLIDDTVTIRSFTISTSRFGVGNREGSQQTPPGVHRITKKIGNGAPEGRIFKDRRDTGINWHPGLSEDNLILTRILRLEGLEEGVNRGPGIDSYERLIYIHGTNQVPSIGTPLSHGCVCMDNRDIIDLFDVVEEGTIVIID
jgi:hypothetical protein